MRRGIVTGILAGVFAVAMVGGAAQAETFICQVKSDGVDTGWIAKTIAINVDDKTSTVLVSDSVIVYFNKKPVTGRLSYSSDKRLTVTWEVRGTKDDKSQNVARFMYRATILRPSNKVMVSAQPSGYHNSFSGRGRCKIRK